MKKSQTATKTTRTVTPAQQAAREALIMVAEIPNNQDEFYKEAMQKAQYLCNTFAHSLDHWAETGPELLLQAMEECAVILRYMAVNNYHEADSFARQALTMINEIGGQLDTLAHMSDPIPGEEAA